MIEGCIYIEGRYVHKFSILPKQIYLATRDINYLSFMMAANGFIIGLLHHICVSGCVSVCRASNCKSQNIRPMIDGEREKVT